MRPKLANEHWRPNRFSYELWGCEVNFVFPTVKLTDFREQWAELEQSDNPFAVVVMAHLKTWETQHDPEHRQFWKYYLIRHLYDRGYARQDILNLFRFIDWIMRLPVELEEQWIRQVEQLEAERQMQYVTSVERFAMQRGREEGLEEGREEEAIRLLLHLLTHRFGEVAASIQAQLKKLSLAQLEPLVDAVLTSQSVTEFAAQLPPPDEATTAAR